MPPFTIGRLPRIDFGAGRIAALPGTVARHGRRALLVTGARSFHESPRYAWLSEQFAQTGTELLGEERVGGEPSPDGVDAVVSRHRSAELDVVVGIGGGSVLDAAKAIAGLLRTGTSVRDHLEGVGRQLPYPGPSVPLVAVPTTAGTGSEVTRNAVLTERGVDGFKRSFRDERLVAADAIIDPDLLAGAPPSLIATNGLDAITQLLESYVSVRASPVTDVLALAGLAAARDALPAWFSAPDGPAAPAARSSMAWAALLSGICLAHAGLGVAHGLASPLGAFFPIPHGAACGAVLASGTRANIRALADRQADGPALERYATLGRLLARLPDEAPADAARDALIAWLERLTSHLAIPGLAAFGITDADLPGIVADSRGSSMRTNPIVLSDAELNQVLRESL